MNFAGASRIAVRKYIVPQMTTLTYLVEDHLGSTSLAVDASTGEVIETRYCEASRRDKAFVKSDFGRLIQLCLWWADHLSIAGSIKDARYRRHQSVTIADRPFEPKTRVKKQKAGLSFGFLCLNLAVPTGFEPAISALTGPHVWPLHHGTSFYSGQEFTIRTWACQYAP